MRQRDFFFLGLLKCYFVQINWQISITKQKFSGMLWEHTSCQIQLGSKLLEICIFWKEKSRRRNKGFTALMRMERIDNRLWRDTTEETSHQSGSGVEENDRIKDGAWWLETEETEQIVGQVWIYWLHGKNKSIWLLCTKFIKMSFF